MQTRLWLAIILAVLAVDLAHAQDDTYTVTMSEGNLDLFAGTSIASGFGDPQPSALASWGGGGGGRHTGRVEHDLADFTTCSNDVSALSVDVYHGDVADITLIEFRVDYLDGGGPTLAQVETTPAAQGAGAWVTYSQTYQTPIQDVVSINVFFKIYDSDDDETHHLDNITVSLDCPVIPTDTPMPSETPFPSDTPAPNATPTLIPLNRVDIAQVSGDAQAGVIATGLPRIIFGVAGIFAALVIVASVAAALMGVLSSMGRLR